MIGFKVLKTGTAVCALALGVFAGEMDTAQDSSRQAAARDSGAPEQDTSRKYFRVRVNGLACPFCAYGLEKNLLELPGIMGLHIDLKGGFATFHVPSNRTPEAGKIKKIVEDAGFSLAGLDHSDKPFPADRKQ